MQFSEIADHLVLAGADDIDVEGTEVTRTGVAYRRVIAASSVVNNTALQCSMQFELAVQPTASLPELENSHIPPDYSHTWTSPPILIVGQYRHHTHRIYILYIIYIKKSLQHKT